MRPLIVGYRDTITRRRRSPGGYDENTGAPVPGVVTETELRASVQPLAIEDSDFVGGVQLVERIKVYVPESDALVAAFDQSVADEVVIGTKTYTVEVSRSWPTHTRATVLRTT